MRLEPRLWLAGRLMRLTRWALLTGYRSDNALTSHLRLRLAHHLIRLTKVVLNQRREDS